MKVEKTEQKTHWRKLDNPDYLGAYSLMDGNQRDLIVMIEKVVIEDVKNERGTEPCKVAYLKGRKPMILNTTNCRTIEKILESPFIDDWKGQHITLYVAKIKAFGETLDALRVRPKKPLIKLPELTPTHNGWDGAKKAIEDGSYTIDQIKTKYSVSQENEKLLCKSSK